MKVDLKTGGNLPEKKAAPENLLEEKGHSNREV